MTWSDSSKGNIRVLHLITSGDVISGAERVLLDLSRNAPSHWELKAITLGQAGELSRALERTGCATHSLGLGSPRRLPKALSEIRRAVRAWNPHVIHCHLFHASLMGALLVNSRSRVVQTRHYASFVEQFSRKWRGLADRWSVRRFVAIAAVSHDVRCHLLSQGVDPSRIEVIPNGVDLARLSGFVRRSGQSTQRPDDFVLGTVASLYPAKGADVLLGAIAMLRKSHRVVLKVIGEGPDKQRLMSLASGLGISDCVQFLGYRSDALDIVSRFHVYVQPSISEGFGLAAIEAMAIGIPIVASDTGGLRETIQHEKTGLLVPPGDSESLARAIEKLMGEPDVAKALAEAAQASVRRRYSVEEMVARYDDWYRVLLEPS